MDQIDDDTLEALTEMHLRLAELRAEARRLIEETNERLAQVADRINIIREEAHALVEPAARGAAASYEAKPWLWQDNEAGQAYRDWRDSLCGARDILGAEVRLQLKPPRGFVLLDDVLNVFEEGFQRLPGA